MVRKIRNGMHKFGQKNDSSPSQFGLSPKCLEGYCNNALSPINQVERVFLTEFLKLFVIPAPEKSQTNDEEMGFDAGYLARSWPFKVRSHILSIKSYQEFPEKFFPATEVHLGISLKDVDHANFFRNNIQVPFLKEAAASITQHGGSWLEFPKFFSAGAVVIGIIYFGDQSQGT